LTAPVARAEPCEAPHQAQPACRLCAARLENVFLDLGPMPLANSLLDERGMDAPEPAYPLVVFLCERCMMVQTPPAVGPEALFSEYAYFSSYSEAWLDHARRFATQAIRRLGLGAGSLVLEVASNDGYLLRWFRDAGIPVLGVEPAANVAAAAAERGVPTLNRFFRLQLADELARQGRQADLLVANNVLAHVPELDDFVAGLGRVLKPEGALSIEFPHIQRLIAGVQFDTIYHEHCSYFTLLTAKRALARHGLEVFDAEELPVHGGSLRVWAHHRGGPHRRTARRDAILASEREARLHEPAGYSGFARKVAAAAEGLHTFLAAAQGAGSRVAGYGAPAKATTLLNAARIGPGLLPFTVDRSPHKQGRYIPGARIPILAPEAIDAAEPDFVLLLAWNLREEIADRLAHIADWGGRLVLPLPRAEALP
jgi:SAM-dependent methyltransferase